LESRGQQQQLSWRIRKLFQLCLLRSKTLSKNGTLLLHSHNNGFNNKLHNGIVHKRHILNALRRLPNCN